MHLYCHYKYGQETAHFLVSVHRKRPLRMLNAVFGEMARCADPDGGMSASGSAGPGFDPWQGSKFSFENFQPRS